MRKCIPEDNAHQEYVVNMYVHHSQTELTLINEDKRASFHYLTFITVVLDGVVM
jgi:hypothetical protein